MFVHPPGALLVVIDHCVWNVFLFNEAGDGRVKAVESELWPDLLLEPRCYSVRIKASSTSFVADGQDPKASARQVGPTGPA